MLVTLIRSKQVAQTRNNEQGWPKEYSCNFLEPGAVSYEDVNQGMALLKKETMDTWLQTFVGKPVIIDHQDIGPEDFKKVAVGYITSVWYNADDGWYWCKFIITDDEGHEAIKEGYSVSCSFDVVDTIPGSEWHAIKCDEEIVKGEGLHLALVTSPRYKDCRIVVNSKKAKVQNERIEITIDTDSDSSSEEVNPFSGMTNVELEAKLRQIPSQMAIEPLTENKEKLAADSKLLSQEIEKRKAKGEYIPTNDKQEVELIKKNDTDFSVMSPIQKDKYLETLSDVGLQELVDGDHPGDIKKLAKAHIGDRAKKLQAEEIAGATGAKPVKKKEASKMLWGLFAKKSDKASIKNDKIDATKVFDKVDSEMVPLSTLMNSVGSDFELLQESDAVKINGKDVSIKDLVSAYKNSKNNDDKKDEDEEIKNAEPEKEMIEKKDDCKFCRKCGKELDDDDKKDDDKKEDSKGGLCNGCNPFKKDDDKKNEDEEEEKKDDAKELPNPQTDEGDTAVAKNSKKNGREFFMELENAKNNALPDIGGGPSGTSTREDRAANGKKFFGSKKKR